METKLYTILAQQVSAYQGYTSQQGLRGNRLESKLRAIAERIMDYVEKYMPIGSGIENTRLVLAKSTESVLVFSCAYHHMNETGFYTGYTYHEIKVSSSLTNEINIRITGKDRYDIKEYLDQIFFDALVQDVPMYEFL